MTIRMIDQMMAGLGEMRYQPTGKRVRARRDGATIADSYRPVLVWEPSRITPSYAVPVEDVAGTLVPALDVPEPPADPRRFGRAGPPVLDPRTPFGVHTAAGTSLTIESGDTRIEGAAFRFDEPDLDGMVELDFSAFDWLEEDEPILGHPQDPFHRIDVRRSSRHVVFELNGVVLADSSRPRLLFEAGFPLTRYYLPKDDVRVDLLPIKTRTACAYKGAASHWSVANGSDIVPDVAWSYEDPLPDAADVRGFVAFYQERVDVIVDGRPQERPYTPWS